MYNDADDELDRLFGALPGQPLYQPDEPAESPPEALPPPPPDGAIDKTSPYYEPCGKCRGSGRFFGYSGRVIGECFACKGQGGKMFKTTREQRSRERQARAHLKAKEAAQALDAFGKEYPVEYGWLTANATRNDFAASLLDKIIKYGELTERQLNAVSRCALVAAEREEERKANAQGHAVDARGLAEALNAAHKNGLKRPKMRFDGFAATLAPATGKNPGAIYLKDGDTYLGKILDMATLHLSREANRDPELVAKIRRAMIDPLEQAINYGRATGTCSCCGRTLTDPLSVEAGIGPTCASNFGL